MKAAVLYQLGTSPRYADFADPVVTGAHQIVLNVKAAAVKNLDKSRASGAHYGKHAHLPEVVGVDGVGVLETGERVYGLGLTGMMAEKALIDKDKYVLLPDAVDDAAAAALPNAVMGAALAMKYRAGISPGDTVLINGATGVTGRLAVQVARHYGAAKIIATGRNPESLKQLRDLGADEIISLQQSDEAITEQLGRIHKANPVQIVIDYLWGRPAELILEALKAAGLRALTGRLRFVTVGGMAGDKIGLSSGILRSADIEILGSGFGSISAERIQDMQKEILPEMLQLVAAGKLSIETVTAGLKDIETAWNRDIPRGKRLVILI